MKTHLTHGAARSALRRCALGLAASPAAAQTKWNLPAAYPADNSTPRTSCSSPRTWRRRPAASCRSPSMPAPRCSRRRRSSARSPTGQAQIGEVLISIHENEDPIFGVDIVPFLATSYADAKKL